LNESQSNCGDFRLLGQSFASWSNLAFFELK
jgi:hypothetical protein